MLIIHSLLLKYFVPFQSFECFRLLPCDNKKAVPVSGFCKNWRYEITPTDSNPQVRHIITQEKTVIPKVNMDTTNNIIFENSLLGFRVRAISDLLLFNDFINTLMCLFRRCFYRCKSSNDFYVPFVRFFLFPFQVINPGLNVPYVGKQSGSFPPVDLCVLQPETMIPGFQLRNGLVSSPHPKELIFQ